MSLHIDAANAAALLQGADYIHILTHCSPDGDTLGCGFGLCHALRQLGKHAQVLCADPIPSKYDYMIPKPQEFTPAFLCAVDVAAPSLLGSFADLAPQVQLTIDHHQSHVEYAAHLLLRADYGAASMAVLDVVDALGVELTPDIAACLYTGIATDTGCFKYQNTAPLTHRMAARLMECGAPADIINREMFDTKTRARLEIERRALDSVRFAYSDRVALMTITCEMIAAAGATEDDLEGLAPIPRQIEGVWVGVTLREKSDGMYKISMRSGSHADASAICARLGGGGHLRAAGCSLQGTLEDVIQTVLDAIAATLPEIAL